MAVDQRIQCTTNILTVRYLIELPSKLNLIIQAINSRAQQRITIFDIDEINSFIINFNIKSSFKSRTKFDYQYITSISIIRKINSQSNSDFNKFEK